MKTGNILFIIIFWLAILIAAEKSVARDAPVTTIGSASLCQPGATVIAVTVDNFTNVSSISLRIEYNPTVVSFLSATPNAQLNTMIINNISISPTLSKIMVVWGEITPKSFPNGSAILSLNFNFMNGATPLTFNNSSNNGGDCEYADENGDPMNDMPTAAFYHDGLVQQAPASLSLTNMTVATGMTRCYYATQSVTSAGTGSTFIIQNGGIVNISAGQKVSMLPGTSVMSGGLLHAFVSSECIPCNNTGQANQPVQPAPGIANIAAPSAGSQGSLYLFPNPAKDLLNLRMEPPSSESAQISVYDASGYRCLYQNISVLSARQLNISNLKPGLYLVRIITSAGDYSSRFLKQ